MPFGQVAFFPGELSNAEKVFAEKHLVAAAAAAAAKGSVSATTAAAVAAERGPQIGRGDTALLELPTSEAAALLQQLLPPAQVPQPHPAPQHPPAPAQQAQRVAAKQPTPAEPSVQQAPPPETRQQAQQLSHLVEGRTPEQLEALRAALQQLGAKLEQQAAAAAGGEAPSTEVGFGLCASLSHPHALPATCNAPRCAFRTWRVVSCSPSWPVGHRSSSSSSGWLQKSGQRRCGACSCMRPPLLVSTPCVFNSRIRAVKHGRLHETEPYAPSPAARSAGQAGLTGSLL